MMNRLASAACTVCVLVACTSSNTPPQDQGPPPDQAAAQERSLVDRARPPTELPVAKVDGPGATDRGLAPDKGGSAPTSVTIVVAADIAESGRTAHARALAALVTKHSPPVSAVVLGGDNARDSLFYGLLKYYNDFYKPATQANWGQFDAIAFPQLGNHEYMETNAQGYFDYFAPRLAALKAIPSYHGFADGVGKGYYSFDINGWHFVSLNSNCAAVQGGCGAGGAQEVWLKNDLTAHKTMPLVAIWHAPRYACGGSHSDATETQVLWADLVDAGADLVFAGHNHYYQRWKPLNKANPKAVIDTANGLTEIVVGSYGVSAYSTCSPAEARVEKTIGGDAGIGVFFLTLSSDGKYAFEYRLENDTVFDSGSGQSHHHP